MELRTTGELRRGGQTGAVPGRKTEVQDTPAGAKALQRREPADRLTLSREAAAYLEERSRRMWAEVREREQQRQERMDSTQSSSGELDLLSKGLRVLELCQKIAASIMKGNHVPPEDLKFLMENDPAGYRLAMAMRRHNPDPEDEESVLTDEDKNGGAHRETGGAEAPSVEACGPSGGGGDAPAATE